MLDTPLILFAVVFIVLCLSGQLGALLRRRRPHPEEAEREDLKEILTATLTLLGLVIGFTFSMAMSRYDQRKTDESEEANAIGTEYLRVGVLPKSDTDEIRELLAKYVDERIRFYVTFKARELKKLAESTSRLENDLWNATQAGIGHRPGAMILVGSGMNTVLDNAGYTLAAWRNRIPIVAWALMWVVAVCGNFLYGYNSRRAESTRPHLFVLPLIVSISFLLIAELDSPRGGIARVQPENLKDVSAFIHAHLATTAPNDTTGLRMPER